ncbi:MAG: hypothetical protein MJA32_05870 [Proteobacteria bacterium]|nr:hypothetical protein [Pseudomonadota bacterium]
MLSLLAPAVAWAAEVLGGRWEFGDRHALVTELLGRGLDSTPRNEGRERRVGGDVLTLRWAFESDKWFARAHYDRVGDAVRTGTEFARQVGSDRSTVVVGRQWNGHGRYGWTHKSLTSTWETRRTSDGQLVADRHIAGFDVEGPGQSQLEVEYHSGKAFQAGRLLDLDRVVLAGRVKPRDDVELGVEAHFVELDARDGQPLIDAELVDATLTWRFAAYGSVKLAVQQQGIERRRDAYAVDVDARSKNVGRRLSYSWQVNPGTEIQLGYADAFADPNAVDVLVDTNRSWFMKVGYAPGL